MTGKERYPSYFGERRDVEIDFWEQAASALFYEMAAAFDVFFENSRCPQLLITSEASDVLTVLHGRERPLLADQVVLLNKSAVGRAYPHFQFGQLCHFCLADERGRYIEGMDVWSNSSDGPERLPDERGYLNPVWQAARDVQALVWYWLHLNEEYRNKGQRPIEPHGNPTSAFNHHGFILGKPKSALTQLHQNLLDFSFIETISIGDFTNAFTHGQGRINWTGPQYGLKFFIKKLVDHGWVTGGSHWKTTAQVFLWRGFAIKGVNLRAGGGDSRMTVRQEAVLEKITTSC